MRPRWLPPVRVVLVGGLFAAAAALALVTPACSTGAVGIDACRAIESARCAAAPSCEDDDPSFGIVTEEQVRNCQVFYHDHCLVGLENVSEDPAQDDVNDCVASIEAIAACKADGKTTLGECERFFGPDGKGLADQKGDDADNPDLGLCEVLMDPEKFSQCKFIEAPPEEEEE